MKKLLLSLIAVGSAFAGCGSCGTCPEDRGCAVQQAPICEYDVTTTKRKPAIRHTEVSYSCPAECRTVPANRVG